VLDGVEALSSILIELFTMLSIKQGINCHLGSGYGQRYGKNETPNYPGFIQWSQGALLNFLACFVGIGQNEGKGEEAQACKYKLHHFGNSSSTLAKIRAANKPYWKEDSTRGTEF
jgi:hypothetical protein